MLPGQLAIDELPRFLRHKRKRWTINEPVDTHRYTSLTFGRRVLGDRIVKFTDTRNGETELVARLQELRRRKANPNAGGSPCRNDVAWLQFDAS